MNIQDYLDRLQGELKGLPPDEKSQLVDEISSHISEGQLDPKLDLNRLEVEMGDPKELGRLLKETHHPRHWLEYLLIVIPGLGLFQLINAIFIIWIGPVHIGVTDMDLSMIIGIRTCILIQMGLALAGYKLYKRLNLPAVFLYWISSVWLMIFVLCVREKRWDTVSGLDKPPFGLAETVFWSLLLVTILFGLSKLLWKLKDPLWFTFVSLPFLIALGNLVAGLVSISHVFSDWNPPSWLWNGWFNPLQIGMSLVWPALILFPKTRLWRWLGLLVQILPFMIMYIVLSIYSPVMVLVWIVPLLWVLVNGVLDMKNRVM